MGGALQHCSAECCSRRRSSTLVDFSAISYYEVADRCSTALVVDGVISSQLIGSTLPHSAPSFSISALEKVLNLGHSYSLRLVLSCGAELGVVRVEI
uniref:Uncharacterized protein n=1 Tax=Physcomitrium patens TaxID=3218 RepID=A0A2K1JJN3_PHYPA|nr:hypothetical protein PHYPA_018909 [Physcomitrium patens]